MFLGAAPDTVKDTHVGFKHITRKRRRLIQEGCKGKGSCPRAPRGRVLGLWRGGLASRARAMVGCWRLLLRGQ